ncbi:vWA domain-containing protein [Pirellulaceae bacterium SH449]
MKKTAGITASSVPLILAMGLLVIVGCNGSSTKKSVADANGSKRSEMRRIIDLQAGSEIGTEREGDSANAEMLNTEEYQSIRENPMVSALSSPLSTFSIDVDTASYSNVRRMLRAGKWPEPGAIRLEELVNYFPYVLPTPTTEQPFSVVTELAPCPWQPGHHLMRVSLAAKPVAIENKKRSNLVFLIDVSGSMDAPDKLPLVKSSMKLLVDQLDGEDRVSLVVYAGASGLVLDGQLASDATAITDALDRLKAGGSTNGGAGIMLAYATAEKYFSPEANNRVILCTDGDFNVGLSSESALVELVSEKAKSGVFLTILGFGTGNLKDSKMEQLSNRGNGNYAYIDSLLEARKVLVEEIGGTLETVAKDVKVQLDFNPQFVEAYRLLGYENRLLHAEDFRDDAKDAGELGAGHQVTAFYELRPVGLADSSDSSLNRGSEFVKSELAGVADAILTVNLRYKKPLEANGLEFQHRVPVSSVGQEGNAEFQFAASVLAYGMLLRNSDYRGSATWDWVVATAEKSKGEDVNGLRGEFIELAKLARRIHKTAH